MEYQIGCYYFSSSLEKTLYDLGGKFEDFNNQINEEWNSPKHWKKLKHWENYKWYNRPKR